MLERLKSIFGRQKETPESPQSLRVGDRVFYEDHARKGFLALGEVISINDLQTEVRILDRHQNSDRIQVNPNNRLVIKTGDDRLHRIVFNQSSNQAR